MAEPSQLQVLKVKARSFKKNLEGKGVTKTEHVSIPLSEEFNRLIDKCGQIAPGMKDELPARVTAKSDFSMMGIADSTYFDLEVLVDQLIGLLDLIEQQEE